MGKKLQILMVCNYKFKKTVNTCFESFMVYKIETRNNYFEAKIISQAV